MNVKLAGVKYKNGTAVCKNIQLRFIDSCRFMASSLDELASNLCGTSGIQCDKCKGNMELINISGDYIASCIGCDRCRTKKTKGLGEGLLKRILITPVGSGDVMKNFAWWFEKVYTHTSIWMAGRNFRRQVYHQKMRFTAGLTWRVSVIRIMTMHSKFRIPWRKWP